MKLLLLIILCPLWSIAQWANDFSADLNNWFGDTAFFWKHLTPKEKL